MPSDLGPLWRDVIIVNELGLHARAAAKLAKLAQQATGAVRLQAGPERVDAKQVIDILTLAAGKGTPVKVEVESAADINTLDRIVSLITQGFGE